MPSLLTLPANKSMYNTTHYAIIVNTAGQYKYV